MNIVDCPICFTFLRDMIQATANPDALIMLKAVYGLHLLEEHTLKGEL